MSATSTSQWTDIKCRTCDRPLVAVDEATVPSYIWRKKRGLRRVTLVHCDGWDPESGEIRQLDVGHTPILKTRQAWPK